ncbi:GlsB/YeaQ/YmgE family stress response membrane protein [Candidatus Chlorohelix sp.]|uniref:GlsB/YeaQ/YmgE family stress response membrane protein n=1 Tax=Candidatus Chlorohelix sp. TaxID=3139201 RepID=UPI0030394766
MGGLILAVILIIIGLAVLSVVMSMAFSLVGWLIIGLIAGFLANYMMKGRTGDLIANMVYGLLGSVLSGFILTKLGMGGLDNNLIGGVVFSTIGAMAVIGLSRLFSSNRPTYPR